MLRQSFKFYPRRNFFNSAVWKDSKKEVTSTPKQEAQTPTATTTPPPPPAETASTAVQMDFVPSELEKLILVYSGRYKSKDEIPPRIGYSTINSAKSRVRIKIANYIILGTVIMFGVTIWKGKKEAKAGDSIVSRGLAQRNKILENSEVKKSY